MVVAVDGRSAGGTTTAAQALRACAGARGLAAVVVHIDDIAWHHSSFDRADLLAGGVLEPLRRGSGPVGGSCRACSTRSSGPPRTSTRRSAADWTATSPPG